MQFNAVVLALAAFASVAMAAPKADHPFPKIDEVEKLFPGAKASFNNMAAGQLKERAISGCLYHGKDTCIQCNATCCGFDQV
ncbi:hypothetical protein QBC33DRAFT_555247 [Phialemonium atrogriseum]|uniref:Uncharacterized protein n=1 Tax=Phialemonium atrogriseum TaxID=1093897 RepID=A0AAJ0C9M2_9PEZI|nr:uncharacterized protein QBC33DRAFT_555247 [Phialemonium atrogriseum]KAK1772082.1 hypothetical protein QBC33DRAFT_555247 [Phialemonium atrogriseum]